MEKKKIKINFSDFWGGFNRTDNYFYNLLKEKFDVEISNSPDYLFFSLFGNQHQELNHSITIKADKRMSKILDQGRCEDDRSAFPHNKII